MDHYLNGGAGNLVNLTTGSFHTDQYQLFLLIFSRALKDPRRTLDPSKATTFFVPYDLASDAAYYKKCSRSDGICYDFRKCPLAPTVSELLKASPWYLRNYGKDHVMVIGMNYAMNHHIGKPKCKQLLTTTCYNCTKLAIDDYSYLQSTDAGVLEKGDFWHATPFPADFHWTKETKRPFPWENRDRPILSSYVGSTQSYYGPARRLRQSIAHYCHMHQDLCTHQAYGVNGTRLSFKVEGYNPLQVSASSVFCFQPIGDLMTRKGLFDSILQVKTPHTHRQTLHYTQTDTTHTHIPHTHLQINRQINTREKDRCYTQRQTLHIQIEASRTPQTAADTLSLCISCPLPAVETDISTLSHSKIDAPIAVHTTDPFESQTTAQTKHTKEHEAPLTPLPRAAKVLHSSFCRSPLIDVQHTAFLCCSLLTAPCPNMSSPPLLSLRGAYR
jgi:hypothetical protein